MAGWGYAAVIGAALLAAALVLWQRRQSRKILENLGKMLEAAMEGNFTEASFDESLLSALETQLCPLSPPPLRFLPGRWMPKRRS